MTDVGSLNFHCIIPDDNSQTGKTFYTALFPSWRFRHQPPNEFWEITGPDGRTPQTAFLAIMTGPGTPKTPLQYYTVDSIDQHLSRAVELGAKVVVGKTPVPGVGYFAELADPIGSPFGLWENTPQSPQSKTPKETLKKIGPKAFTAEDYKPGLIRHIVLFQYLPDVTAEQRGQVVERFLALQDACQRNGARYILSIETGAQSSGEGADKWLNQGFIVTFKSEGDRNYYVGQPVVEDPAYYDPAHQVYKDFVKPLVSDSDVLVFDFPVEQQTYLRVMPA
ncbi:Dabb family protein [Sorangium sp. KYC3313]|uniref:Dabb family protein n=1 Tax=Sorangium sp. KYC3313 TaxID=3449740 RepID=UPI003F8A8B93